jgi:DNA repair protein RecO (recombination protein O)
MIVTTDSIIIKSIKYGDSSKIVHAFTRDYGLISLIAKGAYQAKSKFGSALEPLSRSRITLYKKPHTDLHLISGAELISSGGKMRSSLEHIAVGMMILENIQQTQEHSVPGEEIFVLTEQMINILCDLPNNPINIFIYFSLELIKILGFEIDFEISEINFVENNNLRIEFSLDSGYFVQVINGNGKNKIFISNTTFNILKTISGSKIDNIIKIKTDERLFSELNDFFSHYFSFHLEKKFGYSSFNLLKV